MWQDNAEIAAAVVNGGLIGGWGRARLRLLPPPRRDAISVMSKFLLVRPRFGGAFFVGIVVIAGTGTRSRQSVDRQPALAQAVA